MYTTYAQYFAIVDLVFVRSSEHALGSDPLIQLACAWVQLHALPIDDCVDLLSMLDIDLPAFYAAHVCHLDTLIQEIHRGSLLINNESSSLF